MTVRDKLTTIIHGRVRQIVKDFLETAGDLYSIQVFCGQLRQPYDVCNMLDLPSISNILDEEMKSGG